MECEYDLTIVTIKSENSDSEEDEVALAQLRRELQKEPVENNAPINEKHTTNINNISSIVSNCQLVDNFIIYELDDQNKNNTNLSNAENGKAATTRKIEPGSKPRQKRFKPTQSSNITQRQFRLSNVSAVKENMLDINEGAKLIPTVTPKISVIPEANINFQIAKQSDCQKIENEEDIPVEKISSSNEYMDTSTITHPYSPQQNSSLLKKNYTNSPNKKQTTYSQNVQLDNKGVGFGVFNPNANGETEDIFTESVVNDENDTKAEACIDGLNTIELKRFFEKMFEETRKLSLERRQMIKTELLRAVCRAEEDVDAEISKLSPKESGDAYASFDSSESGKNKEYCVFNPSRKKFNRRWLQDDLFKSWLEAVSADPYKCRCNICNKTLICGKSELKKHAETFTHKSKTRLRIQIVEYR